ncbi:PP2C family protein-serine/threonine phosphatase [Aneurinibacillus sp. REN35]|uniref:PP2C family protein-serine/threonine phosphatase n=1 Tax=Aneurinibacillus sp. REN35 TaxID=3237286 RepID=UPI003527FF02
MSIVIAERDEHSRGELIGILHEAGYSNIVTFYNAAHAWTHLQHIASTGSLAEITLILLDTSSLQAALEHGLISVSDDLLFSDLPILIMGKGDTMDIIYRFSPNQIVDYIQKPIHPLELQMRVCALYKTRQYIQQQKQNQMKLEALIEEHQSQLAIAKKVQRSVLSEPMQGKDIAISALYQPSEDLSGDMYCWYEIGRGRYGIILIDVVGHGVSASLVSMSLRALLRGLIVRVTDPVKVIHELNRHIHHIFHGEASLWYFTAFYMIIDTEKRRIEYTNAGHPPAFLKHGDGSIQKLRKGCCPVGIIMDMPVEKEVLSFKKNTEILLYTDGLFNLFGSPEHTYRYIEEQMTSRSQISLQERLAKRIKTEEGVECSDDICIISIQL